MAFPLGKSSHNDLSAGRSAAVKCKAPQKAKAPQMNGFEKFLINENNKDRFIQMNL